MGSKRTQRFYDNWAKQEVSANYEKRQMTLFWKAEVFAELIPRRYQFASLLEVGCAEGILTAELSKTLKVGLAVGIDISGNFLHLGKEKYETVQFLQNDGSLPFKDKSFDLTICSDFLEHVPEVSKYLLEIRRVSKYVLFKIPVELCLIGNLFRGIGFYPKIGQHHPAGHLHLFDRGDALKLIKLGGFSVVNFSFEITPLAILYGDVPWVLIFLNPFTYLGVFVRTVLPKFYLPLLGGNLFAFCKA